jgi:very-short-patch-repair endonuclease
MAGYKFVRQEPLGPFIVDFVCRDAMLAVEVDGATHSTEAEVSNDKRRELYLARLGFEILRINNEDVYQRLDDVLETILARLEGRT